MLVKMHICGSITGEKFLGPNVNRDESRVKPLARFEDSQLSSLDLNPFHKTNRHVYMLLNC